MRRKRQCILIYCANGYSFVEYFKPVIKSLISDFDIELIQGDYCLSTQTTKALEELSSKASFSYRIAPVLNSSNPVFSYHRKINQIIKDLDKKTFDLLILGTDCNSLDRYLINFARSRKIKVVAMHSNIIQMQVLAKYRKAMGIIDQKFFPSNFKTRVAKLKSSQNKVKFIAAQILSRITSCPKKFGRSWRKVSDRYLCPLLFSKTIFRQSKYDKFQFTAGRTDGVICYDPVDLEALKQVVTPIKTGYLARHPSTYYSADISQAASKKLLVLLTSYSVELPQDQFDFWRDSIERAANETGVTEIHLRFHPRTKDNLTWPRRLIAEIGKLGLEVVVVDSNQESLAETAADYLGVIGTVSGSLRTARAASRGFVIGLLKAGGDSLSLLDQDWMLGASEGISWISKAEDIQPGHFRSFFPLKVDRLTVDQILKQILLSQAKRKVSVIIQARMGSERLPGKVLKEVRGRPLLDYLVERVKKARLVDEVIIATTTSPQDEAIARWCARSGTKFYRGDEKDVLKRHYEAAKKYQALIVVRVTSDCPLIDPRVIDLAVESYLKRPEVDFVSNTVPLPCLYPDGMDVEVFDFNLLAKAHHEAVLPSEREHVTFYMWKTGKFPIHRVDPPEQDISQYRFCVDYPEDFQLVKEVLTKLYPENPNFSMHDLIAFMSQNRQLLKLQEGIGRNAGWQRAFDRDRQYAGEQK